MDTEVRQSNALMYVYWAMAVGGPMLALGIWTFAAPVSRQFGAAYTVVAAWLLIAAPWLLNVAAGLLSGEVVLAEFLPDLIGLRAWLVTGVVGRLILVVSAPLVLSIVLLRRGHWIYASAWAAVMVTVVAAIGAVFS
jgi:hypothetical protein